MTGACVSRSTRPPMMPRPTLAACCLASRSSTGPDQSRWCCPAPISRGRSRPTWPSRRWSPGPDGSSSRSPAVTSPCSARTTTAGCTSRSRPAARTTTHRSRRHGRPQGAVEGVALTLTGPHLVVLSHEDGGWQARGRVDLTDRVDVHDEAWLARVEPSAAGPVAEVRSGRFGQVGLRDLRLVTHADGTAYREGDGVLLTATSAGPGPFATGHTSVWHFDPDSFALTHRADLFFRRRRPARGVRRPREPSLPRRRHGGWSPPAPGATSTGTATTRRSR